MKTTLEISDNLFRRTKKLAEREGKTFKSVVEEALVTRLEAREKVATPYLLNIPTVSGEIAPEFLNAPWEKIREEIYAYPFSTSANGLRHTNGVDENNADKNNTAKITTKILAETTVPTRTRQNRK